MRGITRIGHAVFVVVDNNFKGFNLIKNVDDVICAFYNGIWNSPLLYAGDVAVRRFVSVKLRPIQCDGIAVLIVTQVLSAKEVRGITRIGHTVFIVVDNDRIGDRFDIIAVCEPDRGCLALHNGSR